MLRIRIKYHCLIAFFLFKLTFALCQNSSDYFISLENDTIYGDVTLSTNYSKKLVFRSSGKKETKIYKASEVKGFSDDGHIYHSLKLENSPSHEMRELLVDGSLKLYLQKFTKEETSFILSKNNELTILKQTTVVEESRVVTKPLYLRDLKQLLIDQPEMVKRVDRMNFNRKELSALIHDYNLRKNGVSNNVSSNERKIKLSSSLEFSILSKGLTTDAIGVSDQSKIGDINVGMGYLIGLKNHKGQEIKIGIELYRFSNTFSSDFTLGTQTWKFNNYALTVPIRMSYKIGNQKIKPFIFGEFAYNKILSKNYEYNLTGPTGESLIAEDRKIPSLKSIGFRYGVGVSISPHFQILLKYSSFRYEYLLSTDIQRFDFNPFILSAGYVL